MKNFLFTFFLLLEIILLNNSTISANNSLKILKQRLNKIHSFYTKFDQKLTDINGNVLQEGKGELWIRRPNLFKFHLIIPEEHIMISDGKTLWFYIPVIEQVTADWLKNIVDCTPLTLILSNKSDWNQYLVRKSNDSFLLEPKKCNKKFKNFKIKINKNGKILSFKISQLNGSFINYNLNNLKNISINIDKFQFKIPKNVIIDDRRS